MRHIKVTRSAAKTISLSIKFYLAKKKFFAIRSKINPKIKEKSEFLILTHKKNSFTEEDIENIYNDQIVFIESNFKDRYTETSIQRRIEQLCVIELNKAYNNLINQLDDFKIEKNNLMNL